MANVERRLLGVIVHYSPKEGRGIIKDVASGEERPFLCQSVRSDALRLKLAQSNRLGENVFIQPNIYITYTICDTINGGMAGRIDALEAIPSDLDLGAPIIGYIQNFGLKRAGTSVLYGWINPNPGEDEQGSSWFDLSGVSDPALKAHLKANSGLSRSKWIEQAIQVSYWRKDTRRDHPCCVYVALTDDGLRDRWIRQYKIGESDVQAWEKARGMHLSAPRNIDTPIYVELPVRSEPFTMKEIRILNKFHQEAFDVTASNPAQRGQLGHLWEKVERRRVEDLEEALAALPNIAGTKLALICQAACRYLNRDYGDALEMCYNARRYDFAAELAIEMERFDIAQRIAELALYEEPTGKRIQRLMSLAPHTGNAVTFCDYYQEMIDAGAEDETDLFAEAAISLLDAAGIDSQAMDEAEICRTLRSRYARALPPLPSLMKGLSASEKSADSAQTFTIPANRLTPPAYYRVGSASPNTPPREARTPQNGAAALIEDFKKRFMVDKRYRQPDRSADRGALGRIDALLAAELPSVNDYRMPLLVRLCLDPEGSAPAIRIILQKLERDIDKKRRKYDGDRRWLLFTALLEYAQADDASSRAQAWEKACAVAQGDDESLLLNALPH